MAQLRSGPQSTKQSADIEQVAAGPGINSLNREDDKV